MDQAALEKECSCFRKPSEKRPDYPGRFYELCTGENHGGPAFNRQSANKWRASKGLSPLPFPSWSFAAVSPPLNPPPQRRLPPPQRPGLELKQLFESLGVTLPNCFSCGQAGKRMDQLGVEGCRRERDALIADIKSRAKDVPMTTWLTAAANAVTTGLIFAINPLDPIPGLFDEALRRAEEKTQ